jgi:hypothetical protein
MRGRRVKYHSDEERLEAFKASIYRSNERKKAKLAEARAIKAQKKETIHNILLLLDKYDVDDLNKILLVIQKYSNNSVNVMVSEVSDHNTG